MAKIIGNITTTPMPFSVVDQTYSAESANAQSGAAVAEAINSKADKNLGFDYYYTLATMVENYNNYTQPGIYKIKHVTDSTKRTNILIVTQLSTAKICSQLKITNASNIQKRQGTILEDGTVDNWSEWVAYATESAVDTKLEAKADKELAFDYYYETTSLNPNDSDYQRVGIHKIKKTGSMEQPTIIMTQAYAGGLQQTIIRSNYIRLRQIKPDGTMTDWDDYVLNSKLEERLAELDNSKESLNGFDYYVYGEYMIDSEGDGSPCLKLFVNGDEFETYSYYEQIFDDMLEAGIYKIHINNNEFLMDDYPKYDSSILFVKEENFGEISQTLITDGSIRYRSSSNSATTWNPWEENTITVDNSLSSTSTNPVQNKVIKTELDKKASTVYVDEKIASMVDSAPETLDTLNELASALGEDPNFATTVITQISEKADKDSIKYYDDPDIVPTDASYFEYIDNGDGTCQLTKITDKTLADVVIPYEINGLKVTSMAAYMFQKHTSLKSIIIPNSVIDMGHTTFQNCTALETVIIPNSVTKISSTMFKGCTALQFITIPDSVTNIEMYAFQDCSGLKSIIIPQGVSSIGVSTFDGCIALRTVSIPDTVTSIGNYAFEGCKSLVNINLPNSISSIGTAAFLGCENLRCIDIPNKVSRIITNTFYNCYKLKFVTISNNVTEIQSGAFGRCSALQSIKIPNDVTSIGTIAFHDCTALTSITIPSSVTSIAEDTFKNDTNFKIYCNKNSFAETYAIENNIPYEYIDPKNYIGEVSELNTENKETVVGAINELAGKIITETDVDSKIAAMVDSAPETLDTLNELAEALGDDPNFATTVATEIGKKADTVYVDEKIGDIETVLDTIIAMQNELTGGEEV